MATRSSLFAIVLSLWVLVPVQEAQAQSADARYAAAMDMVNAGRYREAVDELSRAIEISPENIFFCNRGIVRIRLEEFNEAIKDLKTCRDTFKGDQEELAILDAQYLAVTAAYRGSAARARQVAQGLILARTQPPSIPADSPVAPADVMVQAPPSAERWGAREYGFLSLIVGGALLGSALTVDLLSAGTKDDFIAASTQGSPQDYQAAKDSVETRQDAFYALGIAGGVMTLSGLSLVLWDVLADRGEAQVQVGTGAGSLVVGWRF